VPSVLQAEARDGTPDEDVPLPYCGHAADISEFTTPEQEDYIRSVGKREAQERILKPMIRGLANR